MKNVFEFNELYFNTIKFWPGSPKNIATMLKVGLSQAQEISKMDLLTVKYLSKSLVAIAEADFCLSDLSKQSDIENSDQIITLNQSYLEMVRHLAATNCRLTHMATRIPLATRTKIKNLSSAEIKIIARSNGLMFKLSLPTKTMESANLVSRIGGDRSFVKALALMAVPA